MSNKKWQKKKRERGNKGTPVKEDLELVEPEGTISRQVPRETDFYSRQFTFKNAQWSRIVVPEHDYKIELCIWNTKSHVTCHLKCKGLMLLPCGYLSMI